jgi:hypothetical protein
LNKGSQFPAKIALNIKIKNIPENLGNECNPECHSILKKHVKIIICENTEQEQKNC